MTTDDLRVEITNGQRVLARWSWGLPEARLDSTIALSSFPECRDLGARSMSANPHDWLGMADDERKRQREDGTMGDEQHKSAGFTLGHCEHWCSRCRMAWTCLAESCGRPYVLTCEQASRG